MSLLIDGVNYGLVHARKSRAGSKLWLTEKTDRSWWIICNGSDGKLRVVGFIWPPQKRRAKESYDALDKPDVLEAFLAGRDS